MLWLLFSLSIFIYWKRQIYPIFPTICSSFSLSKELKFSAKFYIGWKYFRFSQRHRERMARTFQSKLWALSTVDYHMGTRTKGEPAIHEWKNEKNKQSDWVCFCGMVTQPTWKTQPSECQTVTSPCLRPSIRAVSNTHSIRAVSSHLAKTYVNTLQCNKIDTKVEAKNFLKCQFIPTQY